MAKMFSSVLFVCLGNICRSPTAHAVFRHKIEQTKFDIKYDSCGTAAYHKGASPDKRSRKHGEFRGYNFSKLHARPIKASDFEHYDLILAMDKSNFDDLRSICPDDKKDKIKLCLDYASNFPDEDEVPDPYYGGDAGFELVLDLIEDACDGLIYNLKRHA